MRLCFLSRRCAQRSIGRLGAGLACIVLTGVLAAPLQADDRIFVRGPQNANEARIAAALDSETEFEFLETPLQEVIDFLKDFHGIQIQLDQRALEDVGIGSDTPVTRNLKRLALRSALNLVLRDLELTWIVRDEVLFITTEELAEKWLEVRVYNVSDLAVVGLSTDELAETVEASLPATRGVKAQDKTPRSIRALKTLLIVCDNEAGHRNVVNLLAVLRGEMIPPGQDHADKAQPAARRPRSSQAIAAQATRGRGCRSAWRRRRESIGHR